MFNTMIIDQLREYFVDKKETIAVAESVTAGLLQAALASGEFASEFFEGGITAYNINQKVRHLGIDKKEGEACNCVSPAISDQMALGVVKLFQSAWGVAVTGYATPVEESGFSVYAFYSICKNGQILKTEKIDIMGKKGEEAQREYVNHILSALHRLVTE